MESGCFPLFWKLALVKPLLKKDGLDPIFKNYRPVSNLAYASKLVETVVAKQLQHYLFSNDLFAISQSTYRPNHSTETALLKVTNDILLNMNDQRVTLLLLLDLSAAFDTVDHDTLLHRLQFPFGVIGKVLSWFSSYLSGRSQQIAINDTLSAESELQCGVPVWARYYLLSIRGNSSRLSNIILLRCIVTLMMRRYTFHSAQTKVLINLMLRSCWKVALMTFVLGCCMIILN